MRIEQHIVAAWARQLSKKIIKGAIADLKKLNGSAMLSGEGSGLKNIWDEICVQMQSEESFFWSAYLVTIDDFLRHRVAQLQPDQLLALWAVTNEGWDYIYDHHAESINRDQIPVCVDDVIRNLQGELLSVATDTSNKRIDQYLIRSDT